MGRDWVWQQFGRSSIVSNSFDEMGNGRFSISKRNLNLFLVVCLLSMSKVWEEVIIFLGGRGGIDCLRQKYTLRMYYTGEKSG